MAAAMLPPPDEGRKPLRSARVVEHLSQAWLAAESTSPGRSGNAGDTGSAGFNLAQIVSRRTTVSFVCCRALVGIQTLP
jgi:hypothetical protein